MSSRLAGSCGLVKGTRCDPDRPAVPGPIVRDGKIAEGAVVGIRSDRMNEVSVFNKPCRSTVWSHAISSTGGI
jgi:hypothetical protein